MAVPNVHRLGLLIVFTLSRIIYYYAGVRFDARPLDKFFQVFDPVLLKDRLGETLFYAHTQPPGFNLLLGILLKLFPEHLAAAAHVLYLGLGLVILFALFELMRKLGVDPAVAAAACALFIISPGIILFENLLMYEYPLLALLCVGALCWRRLFERPRIGVAFALFSVLGALVLTRFEKAVFAYFLPTTDFPYFKEARAHIQGFDRWFNTLVFGQLRDTGNRKELRAKESTSVLSLLLYTGVFLMIGLPLLFLYGCWQLWRGVKREPWTTPRNALLAFLLFHIMMITALVNLLSSFENNRYRLPIDGFFLVLAAMAADAILRWYRSRRDPGAPGSEFGRHP